LQEGLGGIKDVIVMHAQPYFQDRFYANVVSRAHVKRNRDVAIATPRHIIETLMMVSMAGALVWLDAAGGIAENFSTIAFLAVVTVRLLPMSNRVLAGVSTIRTSMVSIGVIHENARCEMSGNAEVREWAKDDHPGKRQSEPFSKLDVDRVSFGYSTGSEILEKISFSVQSGETIGIVGGSGAGKTTLVDLLLGLLTPIAGKIYVNGKDIHAGLGDWQSSIGYVQQSVFLLDASIRENIAFGVPSDEISDRRVLEVLKLAKLTQWVESLPEKAEALVGERGVRISGGQRQRIGIARSLYHNPGILILDEATSALDNRTEKEIMADVYTMHGDRTIIMIAHRLDTIRNCDRIIVLERGRIAGEGTFDDLMEGNRAFQEISQVYAK
jgi:ATP-binding cassette subfamily C protein